MYQDLWRKCLVTHVGDFTMLTGLCGGAVGVGEGDRRGAAGFHHLCLGFFGHFLLRVLLLLGSGRSVTAVAAAEIPLSIQQGLFDTYRKFPLTLWGGVTPPHITSLHFPHPTLSSLFPLLLV